MMKWNYPPFIGNQNFQSFDFECTWWRLIQKQVVIIKLYIYALLHDCPYSDMVSVLSDGV
jgi:hypothetical protein